MRTDPVSKLSLLQQMILVRRFEERSAEMYAFCLLYTSPSPRD